MSLFAMCVVVCIQTSSVEFFNPEGSSPCEMLWCVLCRTVLYTFLHRTHHLVSFCHLQRELGKCSLYSDQATDWFISLQRQAVSLHQSIQTGSGVHSASISVDIGGSFPWYKVAWCVKLTIHTHLVARLKIGGAIPPHPYMPSWCDHKFSLVLPSANSALANFLFI